MLYRRWRRHEVGRLRMPIQMHDMTQSRICCLDFANVCARSCGALERQASCSNHKPVLVRCTRSLISSIRVTAQDSMVYTTQRHCPMCHYLICCETIRVSQAISGAGKVLCETSYTRRSVMHQVHLFLASRPVQSTRPPYLPPPYQFPARDLFRTSCYRLRLI